MPSRGRSLASFRSPGPAAAARLVQELNWRNEWPNVRDVMTKDPASCVQPGDAISKVAGLMKQDDVGSVPVVESPSQAAGRHRHRPRHRREGGGGRTGTPSRRPVKDAMTPNPASCREDDDVDQALKLMKERQVRRMPIVDGSGRLAGIIAQADVATRVNKDSEDRRARRSDLRVRDERAIEARRSAACCLLAVGSCRL